MKTQKEVSEMIQEIESSLSINTKGMPCSVLSDILSDRLSLMALSPEIMEFASWYHSTGRSYVYQEICMDERLKKEKADTLKLYVVGRLAEHDSFYEKATQVVRALEKNIEGIRTIISLEKESLRLER